MELSREMFRDQILCRIKNMDGDFIELTAKEIHLAVGVYPKRNHRMPMCCSVMREIMKGNDVIIDSPPKGNGASLKTKYYKQNH